MGKQGLMATVFQAECHGIIEGLELVNSDHIKSLTIYTDNQAV